MFKKIALRAPLTAALAMTVVLGGVAQAEPSAAKSELISKVLLLQRPAIEGIATMLAQQPAAQMMQGATVALQTRIAPDKREAIAKDIQADLKKYVDDTVPLLRERAVKLAPTTVGTLLDERFSEEELRQLVAIMESPVNKKFGQMNGDLQKSIGEKLVADTRSQVEPKVKALEQSIAKRLGVTAPAAAPAANGAGAATTPASK